jgi:hypothetical protein
MRKGGVKVTDEIRSVANGKIKFAFIEGPDKIRIELIEGHARKESCCFNFSPFLFSPNRKSLPDAGKARFKGRRASDLRL